MSIETSSDSSATVSARKLRANRRNARKSTGPSTNEGKRASAHNSLVHGLYCSDDFILPGESRAQFLFSRQELIRSLLPRDAIELALVERIAFAKWKIKRLQQWQQRKHQMGMQTMVSESEVILRKIRHEDGLFSEREKEEFSHFDQMYIQQLLLKDTDRIVDQQRVLECMVRSGLTPPAYVLAMQKPDQLDQFERLEKMEQRLENSIDKALRELERLRKARQHKDDPEDQWDNELACPYLEDIAALKALLDEENEQKKQAVERVIKEMEMEEEKKRSEANEEESDDKSSEYNDLDNDLDNYLDEDETPPADETEENEAPHRDTGVQPLREAAESPEDADLDDLGTA
jgi:hypothetical protein